MLGALSKSFIHILDSLLVPRTERQLEEVRRKGARCLTPSQNTTGVNHGALYTSRQFRALAQRTTAFKRPCIIRLFSSLAAPRLSLCALRGTYLDTPMQPPRGAARQGRLGPRVFSFPVRPFIA